MTDPSVYDPHNYLTSRVAPGMRRLVELLWFLRAMWPSFTVGSGWRPGSVEHNSTFAADLIIASRAGIEPTAEQKAGGDRMLAWLLENRVALKLRGIIWHGYVYGYSDASWKARRLTWKANDPGNQHRDHIHVYGTSAVDVPLSMRPGATTAPTPAPAPAPKPTAPKPATGRTLSRGSIGDDVKHLQEGLLRVFPAYARRISRNGGPNRNYGPATEAVVKEFQRRSNLTADGIVGPVTRAALARYGIKP